jgi:hypothetical protein
MAAMSRAVFFLFLLARASSLFATASAVTYEFSGGRLGDNLLAYLHAKWFCYKREMPFVYKPFPYSSELVMDDEETHYEDVADRFITTIKIRGDKQRIIDQVSFLYVCPYFPEIKWELERGDYCSFVVDWKNPKFREQVTEMIWPKQPLSLVTPLSNRISIAMHVREGGGFDDDEHPFNHPLKSPPISFYADCLKKIFNLFGSTPLYCHVFTDAMDPKGVVDQIVEAVPDGMQIIFDYRKEGNHHNANVLEDFFSLFNFDILIRPESNFSIVPCLMHSYMIVYYPTSFSMHDRVVKIEEIKAEFDAELLIEALDRIEGISS